jgi:signal transduction histidine kinase
MSKHLLYFLIINTLIILLLIWNSYVRFNDFKEHHITLAEESVKSLSNEVNGFIKEHQRLVSLFGEEHKELIKQLIKNPDNDKLQSSMEKHLLAFFPGYFSFTIADKEGTPYLVDFDGHIGELCTNEISGFAASKENRPRVHPGLDAYHFDVMTSLQIENTDLIFFVSFNADTLGKIIRTIEVPDHILRLVLKNDRLLLEANSQGARNKIFRDDYRLTEQETSTIIASTPVSNSRWHAVDSHHPALFSDYLEKNIIEAGFFSLISLLITAFFYQKIKKEEARRIIAENSKNDFLSIISHELRTPLTSIHGAISLLADTPIKDNPEKSSHMLDVAKRNCNQLLFLINEILDFRKIETGKLEYDFQRIELNSIVEEALFNMEDYAKQYNADIIFSKYDNPVYVRADAHRILQVVNNLLSNAIKYGAAAGQVIVNIILLDDFVRVNFHDKGPGIPEEFADKIFDKFTQANITGKTSSGSAGLGLNIAKKFIDAHGGKINFTTSDKGTTFYFDLPLYQDEE